jgi:hypothetical protein
LPFDFVTAQKQQLRVQISPKIIKVNFNRLKHLPKLGHFASWQTVFTRSSERKRICAKAIGSGKSCLNQAGRTEFIYLFTLTKFSTERSYVFSISGGKKQAGSCTFLR